ncbi:MAG: DNA polymerase III subunit gamma and tau [Actinomycetales bacterium]
MSTALYRRYRPERFEDVIGQEHVTEPLQQALRNDRISHAYLFSGPRGCGKTTSARILARCLNCEKGPTPTPCGECRSCLELSRDGSGNLDVVEIDAASHGGVDDARDLREKAFFAPASSRFKIYIIDEAHMVSPQGFNALLKIVEEPPPHLKFVFATTEPEKVIGTIRSRTHHYPFRLVPPARLQRYLEQLCDQEQVAIEKPALPLVVRAGGGSVRDTLSVLDQLIAGAGPDGVTYGLARGLLGFTDAALLDDIVEALAAGDGAEVFRIVDRVIEAGHNPRRFVEDLLERLRDLIVLDAVPDAAGAILGEAPPDQLERMRGQAGRFGSGALTRAADIVSTGLTEMRGATAPRLQLELICARVLLPAAYQDERSLASRLDRLERRLSMSGGAPSAASAAPAIAQPSLAQPSAPPPVVAAAPTSARTSEPMSEPTSERTPEPMSERTPAPMPERTSESVGQAQSEQSQRMPEKQQPEQHGQPPRESQPSKPFSGATTPDPTSGATAGAGADGRIDLATVRRYWPEVLERVKGLRRGTWTLLVFNAQVVGADARTLTLGLVNSGARDSFTSGGSPEIVRQAVIDVLGVDLRIDAVVDPTAEAPGPSGRSREQSRAGEPTRIGEPTRNPIPNSGEPSRNGEPIPSGGQPEAGQVAGGSEWTGAAEPAPSDDAPVVSAEGAGDGPPRAQSSAVRAAARAGISPLSTAATAIVTDDHAVDDEIAADDPDAEDDGLVGAELLARELGAQVIGEYDEPR